jgi:hypothetical protein
VRDVSGHRLLHSREILRFGANRTGVTAFSIHGGFSADFTLDELERR